MRDESFWIFNGRCWEIASRAWIEKKALSTLLPDPDSAEHRTTLLVKDVVELLKMEQAHNGDPLRFNSPPIPVINCRNSELWFNADGTVDPREHHPKSYLRHCLAVDYEPTKRCPLYNSAIKGIFAKARDPKAMMRLWHELLAYILQPTRHHALIIVLYGAGNNGKARLLQTAIRLLGQTQVHSGRVEELESNRFVIGNLIGKLLFADDDVARNAHFNDGALKKLSETKELTGEKNSRTTSLLFKVRLPFCSATTFQSSPI